MNDRIRQIRKAAGLSQSQFAKRLDVDTATVSLWERDGKPSKTSIRNICKTFGINEVWLKSGVGDPTDSQNTSVVQTAGDRLRILRKNLGLTQKELAAKIGKSEMSVVFWERGSNFPKRSQLLICETFGVNPEWLESGVGVMVLENANYKYESPRQFAERNGCNSLEASIFERFFALPEHERRFFLQTLVHLAAGTVPISVPSDSSPETHSISISGPISVKDLYRCNVNVGTQKDSQKDSSQAKGHPAG